MQKNIFLFLLLSIVSLAGFSQVQRTPVKHQKDSVIAIAEDDNKTSRKEMFRELDLSREQKIKMKEISQAMKTSKEAIENDAALTDVQKKQKLRSLKKEQALKIQAILTEEQRIKFREQRKNKSRDDR